MNLGVLQAYIIRAWRTHCLPFLPFSPFSLIRGHNVIERLKLVGKTLDMVSEVVNQPQERF
jgi:hypothetical protein